MTPGDVIGIKRKFSLKCFYVLVSCVFSTQTKVESEKEKFSFPFKSGSKTNEWKLGGCSKMS